MGVEPKIWERSYPKHSCLKDGPEIPKQYPPHFSVNCFPHGGFSKAVLSGPDGLAHYRAPVPLDKRPIANYQFTSEGSYDAEYLWRGTPIPGTPVHLRPRSAFAGEVGWHALAGVRDPDPRRTGHQILLSEFWQQSNDRGSHRYQDVWYPGPGQAGKSDQSYYFDRFPNTGYGPRRARTASCDSRYNHVGSSVTSRPPIASRSRRQRVPSATKTTDYDNVNNIVSVEPSESSRGSNEQGGSRRQLKHRAQSSPAKRRVPEDSSSNSYTTYMRLSTPSSSQTHHQR